MSYSFNLRAPTKDEAREAVAVKLDQVARNQVCHERDKAQHLVAVISLIDLLEFPTSSQDIVIAMSGSLTGQWEGSDVVIVRGANVSIGVGLAEKLPPNL